MRSYNKLANDKNINDNTDNYYNPIIETLHIDQYKSYELVNDRMTEGYYINFVTKDNNARVIMAKFHGFDQNNNWFYANIFWQGLKSKSTQLH